MREVLFEGIKLGDIEIKNRIVMAPLTRQRAGENRVPNDLMATYYAQRSGAGLIISEATSITPMGVGYKDTPGIWNQEQIDGWKKVTQAVHNKGGKIVLQLWHVGRISHPDFLNGELPIAPSAIKPEGYVSLVRPKKEFVEPRALETREVKNLVQMYKKASLNALAAGFDGVELHAANGYLIDQFLQSSTNKRTDEYGGSVENRTRFLTEIVDACIEVCGSGRVGVHLSPACDYHDMGDENSEETFVYVANELKKREIAFIFTREPRSESSLTPKIKEAFQGPVIINQDLSVDDAIAAINSGQADAASWGKFFISNPDLVERVRQGLDFSDFKPETFYTHGAEGYTDYPIGQ